MRLSWLIPVFAAVVMTGCGDMLSMETLVTKDNVVFDPALVGAWNTDDVVITVQKGDEQSYNIRWISTDNKDAPKVLSFDGHLVKIGSERVMDLVSSEPGGFAIPGHVFLRVRPAADGLKVQFIDSKWLRDQLTGRGLASFVYDGSTVLTAPAAQVEGFLLKFGLDERALDSPMQLRPLKRK